MLFGGVNLDMATVVGTRTLWKASAYNKLAAGVSLPVGSLSKRASKQRITTSRIFRI